MNEPFIKGCYYHIYNRGIDGMDIFYKPANYIYLLKKIKTSFHKYGVDIIAYCLMPNHYYFLVGQQAERPLCDWIQWL